MNVTAREPRVVEIDGVEYHLSSLPPRRALKLLVRVLRAAGPGLVTIMAGMTSAKSLLDLDMSALGDMARTMFVNLTPEEHDAIMAELLEPVQFTVGGKFVRVMPVFDAHFMSRLPAALRLEWECLAENYRDFGDALAALGVKAGAPSSSAT